MEFEDVSEEIEWEARRVAAAFGVEEWRDRVVCRTERKDLEGRVGVLEIRCIVSGARWGLIGIWSNGQWVDRVSWGGEARGWTLYRYGQKSDLFVRGLYRLGFEAPAILDQLPSLTAHEKLAPIDAPRVLATEVAW